MSKFISSCCIASMAAVCFLVAPGTHGQEHDELAARLDKVEHVHPRLFFDTSEEAALKAKIESDPLLQRAFAYIVADAEGLLEAEPVKREKVGKRLLGVSRTCLQRVMSLSFAYRLTGEKSYLARAEREMVAAANFEDWNPSHFLDVAEMTTALAIGYDWLYNDLDADARDTIRQAIIDKGLRTSLEGGWWVTTDNNWNQVCHGGLTLGALAVLEDEPDLAKQIIARGLKNLPRAMHEYEPDGVYPEGPSYWKYGTTYNVILIDALESVLGTDFGLADRAGFMRSADFYMQASGPTGLFFNFSDCGTRGGVAPAMYWFAERRQDPSLLWRERQELAAFVRDEPGTGASLGRTFPMLLIWSGKQGEPTDPGALHWKGDGRTPIALHRSGWGIDDTYLGIKGGSPSTNHAHMDTGSFVLDMNGVRWAVDLGSQSYNSLESKGIGIWGKKQDSERWTVFRLNNFSHNTLVVDDQLQRVDGHAPITHFSDSPSNPFSIVDMTPVYEGQLKQAHRGFRLQSKAVLVQDELQSTDHDTTVRWGMATRAHVELHKDGSATLSDSDKTLTLRVLAPKNVKLSLIDMETPPRDYDAANPDTRMIAVEIEIPASSSETLAVYLAADPEQKDAPAIVPLADWPAR